MCVGCGVWVWVLVWVGGCVWVCGCVCVCVCVCVGVWVCGCVFMVMLIQKVFGLGKYHTRVQYLPTLPSHLLHYLKTDHGIDS